MQDIGLGLLDEIGRDFTNDKNRQINNTCKGGLLI
jgi:uncharacterized protein YnzC (UPF0291/DUF896 family)